VMKLCLTSFAGWQVIPTTKLTCLSHGVRAHDFVILGTGVVRNCLNFQSKQRF
jgi:hypothetical protein